MKSKEELKKLSEDIGKAIVAYHNAICDNLKECGKELKVIGDNDEGEKDGMHLFIVVNHNDLDEIVVDKVRYNNERGIVEVHICEEEYEDRDYWFDISYLGDDADYVNENIDWECL